jgi:NAD(P)-dependent dehydrogenase (short-subunit alcohol dehydrogenase family)
MTPAALTAEGYEQQFGVNHVGHALFTQSLMPLLLKTASTSPPNSVRIINIASSLHASAPGKGLALADAKTDMSSYQTATRYGHSKLANILFSRKLAELYPSVTSVALHPGFVNTEMNNSKGGGAKWLSLIMKSAASLVGKTPEDGAKTQIWCGVAKEVESGKYYEPIGVAKSGSKFAQDAKLKNELWEWTEKELRAHGGVGWP